MPEKSSGRMSDVSVEPSPVEAAYGRLREASHFWKQALASYDNSESFRVNVNACIQALRNITWSMQSEKDHIPGFDPWYAKWQQEMDADLTLRWLVKAGKRIAKQADLKTAGKARAFLMHSYHETPIG